MMEALAVLGWLAALVLWVQRRQHTCLHEAPSKAVLIAANGIPESIRTLRGRPPQSYTKPHGKGIHTLYKRVGTAAVYQP